MNYFVKIGIIFIVTQLVILLATRWLWNWYWKINKRVEKMDKIINSLENFEEKLYKVDVLITLLENIDDKLETLVLNQEKDKDKGKGE